LDMVKVIEDFKTKARLADKRGNKSDFSSEDEICQAPHFCNTKLSSSLSSLIVCNLL
jgi:hypothetical protein